MPANNHTKIKLREPKPSEVCKFFFANEVNGEILRHGFAQNEKGEVVGVCLKIGSKKIAIATIESLYEYLQVYGTPIAPTDELERQLIFSDLT